MNSRMRVTSLLSAVALSGTLLLGGTALAADDIQIAVIPAGSPATPIGNTILANPVTGLLTQAVFAPDQWIGAGLVSDTDVYGRPAAALYAQSTGNGTGTLNFELSDPPTSDVTLTIVGLDDDSPNKTPMEITINDTSVFTGDSMFADWGGVAGEGDWTTIQLTISKNLFGPGINGITISNTATDGHEGETPYILLGGALLDTPGTTITLAQG